MTRNGIKQQTTNARFEKMQRHITEACDREHREFVREWILRLAAERQDKAPQTARVAKAVRKTAH